ncbi:hypothetical protein HMPREF9996_00987 [Aggregatibacter actinomycetemcomitans Y4]|nr:hypothetical protein HMPREF9996_00987 [Aggregatibacter actinomycetemcomitans Y4]PHO20511.1 hypothetical protein CQR80_06350 [Aggregatibacter actinomycetemcomitans]PHO22453.1 hypothetical protein CQR79_07995 [Aggregatibacter actinomycetemcomitans]TYA34798.1 hypothetical protein FXB68_06585 [Aggregatibacter actinomycetemcomitans]TYA38888.1 hypothetical protein FXB79_06280 [Aggregatibacter actinomycetemcomitans]
MRAAQNLVLRTKEIIYAISAKVLFFDTFSSKEHFFIKIFQFLDQDHKFNIKITIFSSYKFNL